MDHIKSLKIVITAGASGIGAEIAKTLSEAGAQVIICDKDQSKSRLHSLKIILK